MRIHNRKGRSTICAILIAGITLFSIAIPTAQAAGESGEQLYRRLTQIARSKGDMKIFKMLNADSRKLDWGKASEVSFVGNIRHLKAEGIEGSFDEVNIYLLRKLTGEIYILTLPEDKTMLEEGADSCYAGLDSKRQDKLNFKLKVVKGVVNGVEYQFAQLTEKPSQVMLDRIFKIAIILMLFFVMVGMGLTLTLKDFAIVFVKPKGMILGEILQFGFMPLMALLIGHLLGFYSEYPFIFVGMILITAIPGGVTSNLMTYYAKGDLALSISLTSFSTVLSLLFTPLLLALYCANVPEVTIPVKIVVQTILILVIVPLFIGMSVRSKWEKFAEKATPFFSALGVIALLFLIVAGVLSNLHIFADTDRYGFKFYSMVFAMTFLGMAFGALFSKMIGINNYQTRAISLETGLRNASLAMAIAILIQDFMGDFYSSMFVVSGIFGLWMYIAGFISIYLFKKVLPVEEKKE